MQDIQKKNLVAFCQAKIQPLLFFIEQSFTQLYSAIETTSQPKT